MSSEVQGASDGPFGDFQMIGMLLKIFGIVLLAMTLAVTAGTAIYLLWNIGPKKATRPGITGPTRSRSNTLEEFDTHFAYHFAFAVRRWRRILWLFTMGYGGGLGVVGTGVLIALLLYFLGAVR